jgi:hypothetical protein
MTSAEDANLNSKVFLKMSDGLAAYLNLGQLFMKYRIDEHGDGLDISVDNVKDKKDKLLQAFQECQEGRCSCPTEEYKKLDQLEIEHNGENIRLRLTPKRGVKMDKAEIDRCLEYTAERVKKDHKL